jgi:short-subunit dehydrogenase
MVEILESHGRAMDPRKEDEMGEKALVTGASSGIGRETAALLAGRGFRVIAVARRGERLQELAGRFEGIIPKQVDLSVPEEVEALCREIADPGDPVTVLINNAGYSIRGALEDITPEAARRLFEVNFFAMIRITQACIPGMRKLRKGTIVNLSSIVGKFPFPMGGVYAASKYAVEAISDALRMELRPFGIRVITIRPGVIASEFNQVAAQMTGDLMARTDEDYKPVYQAVGAGVGKMFAGLTIPGPELIADTIVGAVASSDPKPVYAAGPFVDDILPKRFELDDAGFDRFWTEKTGLAGMKVA